MEPWPYGASTHHVPRFRNETPGKPRRVSIYADGVAECGCTPFLADRRRRKTWAMGEGCGHVLHARRWAADPCRTVIDELLRDWGDVATGNEDDRVEFAAHAVRRMQDARNEDDARKAHMAAVVEIAELDPEDAWRSFG